MGAQAVTEEDRAGGVPGVAEVPDLVAADNHRVMLARLLRPVEREARGLRQAIEGVQEGAGLGGVARQVGARGADGQLRLEGAVPLLAANLGVVVVEEKGVVACGAQALHQTAGLPVGAVVDATVQGEDADLHELRP